MVVGRARTSAIDVVLGRDWGEIGGGEGRETGDGRREIVSRQPRNAAGKICCRDD